MIDEDMTCDEIQCKAVDSVRLSVVMPTYNQGCYISQAIESVVDQQGVDHELIVIDGSSTDGTRQILSAFSDRIKWKSEPDNGQTDAINKGFALASGDILAWLNSDDYYEPGALKLVMDLFESNPEIDVIYGDLYTIDKHGRRIRRINAPEFTSTMLDRGNPIPQPSTFFRRSLLQKVGALDTSLYYCMDYDLWFRLKRASSREFVHINEPLATFRVHGNSKSYSIDWSFKQSREHIFRVRRRHVQTPLLVDYFDLLHDVLRQSASSVWRRIRGRV